MNATCRETQTQHLLFCFHICVSLFPKVLSFCLAHLNPYYETVYMKTAEDRVVLKPVYGPESKLFVRMSPFPAHFQVFPFWYSDRIEFKAEGTIVEPGVYLRCNDELLAKLRAKLEKPKDDGQAERLKAIISEVEICMSKFDEDLKSISVGKQDPELYPAS